MVMNCVAYGCLNAVKRTGEHISFFRFPLSDPERLKRWEAAVKRLNWSPGENHRICSQHFVTGKPNKDPTHPDYIPSIFTYKKAKPKKNAVSLARFQRLQNRTNGHSSSTPGEKANEVMEFLEMILVEEANESLPAQEIEHDGAEDAEQQEHVEEVEVQTVAEATAATNQATSKNDAENAEKIKLLKESLSRQNELIQQQSEMNLELRRKNLHLTNQVNLLKEKIEKIAVRSSTLTDKQCKFYAGVNTVALFMWIVSMVEDVLPTLPSVTKADQVLMVLMKIKLGLLDNDIADRFSVSAATVSKVINRTIPALATRLKFLIRWPSKKEVRRTLPKCFRKHFKTCRVVIDCSEIFIQRPGNLTTRAKTYSNYKHHNTLKFLVGITPYGSISFVSKCWGGRISDKEICMRSNFYDQLEPGDMVMADRGFTISGELGFKGARLAIPPFTKGYKQLPGLAVERARRLSAARIHVERLIGQAKDQGKAHSCLLSVSYRMFFTI